MFDFKTVFPSVVWRWWLGDRKGIRPESRAGCWFLVVTVWLELCILWISSCHHHRYHP